ncbi:MAG: FkbM family methyltransferase [Bacteroidetes bacterium]|nr:FkbM family methyltransferase [Bacteroidota bacterium]
MKNRRLIDLPKEIFKVPFLEKILTHLTNNKNHKNFFARLPPLNKSYPKNSIRYSKRNEISYELDISDYIEWLVYFGILMEPHKSLYGLAKSGDIVFDVGANIGETTFNLARTVGTFGAVHSFEPDPYIFSKILKNYKLNTFVNISLNNFALGSDPSELCLSTPVEDNRGGTRIRPTDKSGNKVPVSTVDIYVSEKQIKKIDLIKIDVEGFEHRVLLGAEATLNKFKPKLFIEINDDNLHEQGDSAKTLIEKLLNNGYKIQNAATNEAVTEATDFRKHHFDIIATHE